MNMQQHEPLAWDFCPSMHVRAMFVAVHCPFLNEVHSQEMQISELQGGRSHTQSPAPVISFLQLNLKARLSHL